LDTVLSNHNYKESKRFADSNEKARKMSDEKFLPFSLETSQDN
jgi:hypothetical protein